MRRFAPLLLLMLCMSCDDSSLVKVSKGLLITAQSLSTLQTTVIEGNTQKLISDDTTRVILTLCVQINQAGKDATAVTKNLAKLENPSKVQIIGILKPVVTAVGNMLDNGLLGIKDEKTQQEVRLLLLTIQSTLNGIQLALATGG